MTRQGEHTDLMQRSIDTAPWRRMSSSTSAASSAPSNPIPKAMPKRKWSEKHTNMVEKTTADWQKKQREKRTGESLTERDNIIV